MMAIVVARRIVAFSRIETIALFGPRVGPASTQFSTISTRFGANSSLTMSA
ncbi:hypothetical protein [Burkholderia sp. ABCPW 11]|uniref:hypothetical protein n=1 Tax=Burkholderia sp. ABCPW 11 TaxID=1637859 RepID=UPI000AC864CB|nr:hypothetical protein [Burkholderia sp. ABCPW 11]